MHAACIFLHDVVVRPARAVDREFTVGWGRRFGISSVKAFIESLTFIFGVVAGVIFSDRYMKSLKWPLFQKINENK